MVPALHAAGLRTYALDQRGYSPGARPAAVADYRIPELRRRRGGGARRARAGRRRTWSATTGARWSAWRLAARHPERVHTLTAVSVPHPAAWRTPCAPTPDRRPARRTCALFRKPGKAEKVLLAGDAAALRKLLGGVGDRPG